MSIRLKMATYISFFFKWSRDRRIEQIGLVVCGGTFALACNFIEDFCWTGDRYVKSS